MLKVKEKPADRLNQPIPEQELLGKLDELFSKRLNAMKEKYRKWQLFLAFERGEQWTTWKRELGKLVDLRPSGSNKSRVVFNLIGPFVRSTLSMLSQSNTTMDVVPASFSSEDEQTAKSAQVHLDRIDILNHKSVNDILIRKLMLDFGTAFKLVFWDSVPNMEDLNSSPPDTVEELIQMGKPPEKIPLTNEKEDKLIQRLLKGEIGEKVCNPFEILLDYPLVRQNSDIRDFIRYGLVSLDYIRESYVRGRFVSAEDTGKYHVLNELIGGNNDFFQRKDKSEQVVLKEYYQAPTKDYPQGRNIHWAGGILLHDGVLSHPKGKLGLYSYHYQIDPNDFYGQSYIEPLMEPQVIVNRIFSKLTSWIDKSVKFRVGVPKNAQFSMIKYLGAGDGEVFEYNNVGGTGIVNIAIPQIPVGLFEFLNSVIKNFRDIASRHEVSKGEAPGRVDSARGIRYLQEADSQYLIVPMIVWEEREREVALFKLDLMQEYYKETRQARILGEMRNVKLFNLKGSDLSAGIDINIVRGSAMPRSKEAQNDKLVGLYQLGLLGDQQDPGLKRKMLRWLDIGSIQGVYGAIELGANLQQMELLAMERGEDVPVQSFHDHYTHSRVCLFEMNSPGFPEKPVAYRNRVFRHWQIHVDIIKAMNMGVPTEIPQPKPPPMPGAGGSLGLPEGANPQASEFANAG